MSRTSNSFNDGVVKNLEIKLVLYSSKFTVNLFISARYKSNAEVLISRFQTPSIGNVTVVYLNLYVPSSCSSGTSKYAVYFGLIDLLSRKFSMLSKLSLKTLLTFISFGLTIKLTSVVDNPENGFPLTYTLSVVLDGVVGTISFIGYSTSFK